MQTATIQHSVKNPEAAKQFQKFPPIEQETRSHVETACAAFYLSRRPQTMRVWATYESGPIKPIRINGRLAWPVSELKSLLEGQK
ncbi:hypothetical protein [Collimonas fungivorans]|uniref:hypothetical protein n=1 Tax=Collimonas fungivorans TaxID=158899 RepID=UPI003FA3B5EB